MLSLKPISSTLFAAGIALLLGGCAHPERAEPQSRPPAQHPVDDDDSHDKLARHDDDDDDDDDDAPRAAATKAGHAATGRGKSDSAVTAAPSIDELPDLRPPPRSLSSRIDVEGSMEKTKRPVVPSYKEVPITPEEKKALGLDRERPDDVLAFYKPQPATERGVSTRDRDLSIGIGGRGGSLVGVGRAKPGAETFGEAGRYTQVSGLPRSIAGVDNYIPVRVRVGAAFVVTIGWGPLRTHAEQMPYLEP